MTARVFCLAGLMAIWFALFRALIGGGWLPWISACAFGVVANGFLELER
jgi:hypothetical protein